MASEAERNRIRSILEEELSDQFEDSDSGEEDFLEEFEENTDTEQEGSDSEEDEVETPIERPTRVPTYIGKDKQTKWKVHCNARREVRTRQSNIVVRLPGVKAYGKEAETPIDCWKLFFDDNILSIIVENTNLHIQSIRDKYSRERAAIPTDLTEIKALIGLIYLAGCLKSSRLNTKELWDRTGCGIERFWLTMSENRFLFLLRNIRFDNLATRLERRVYDKFTHIRELFEKFTDNCQKSYTIGVYSTVDEMLLGFRGRCAFRQYMPKKPNKYGLKIFALVDAKTKYLLNWEPYLGKQPEGPFVLDNSPMALVQRLVRPISGTGRNVTCDNFFTSFPLIKKLNDEHRLTMVGTVRKNKRELPLQFVNTKERTAGSSMFAFQRDVTLVSYVPKKGKNVILASSMHHDDTIDTSNDQNKPEIIMFYNSTKGGVDTVDELCASYDVSRKTRRWPMVIFYGLMNVAGINSQVIYIANSKDTVTPRRLYLKGLALALTEDHLKRRSMLTNLPPEIRQRRQEVAGTSAQHPTADQYPEGTRKRCFKCRKESKSKYYCKYCKKFICLSHAEFSCSDCPASQ